MSITLRHGALLITNPQNQIVIKKIRLGFALFEKFFLHFFISKKVLKSFSKSVFKGEKGGMKKNHFISS